MTTPALQVAEVDMLIADNESLLYAFEAGIADDLSWGLAHKTLIADFKLDNNPTTGVSFRAQSTDDTIIISDEINRIFSFNVPRDVIHLAGVGKYVYDLVMVDMTLGTVQRLWKGKLTIEQGISRDNTGTSP